MLHLISRGTFSLVCRINNPVGDARQHGRRSHGVDVVPQVRRTEERRRSTGEDSSKTIVRRWQEMWLENWGEDGGEPQKYLNPLSKYERKSPDLGLC